MGISSISHARTRGDPRLTVFHVELVLLRRFVGSARGEAQFVVFQAQCLVPRPARYLKSRYVGSSCVFHDGLRLVRRLIALLSWCALKPK